jgi:hypothetical protein
MVPTSTDIGTPEASTAPAAASNRGPGATNLSPTHKLTLSAVVIALYVALMFLNQGFAFGAVQLRFTTALYALAYLFPFLVFPLGLANMLSNILYGGMGPLDWFGGFTAGVLTSLVVAQLAKHGRHHRFVALPIILIPGLLAPIWLAYLLGIPYPPLALSVCAGQVPGGILGWALVTALRRVPLPMLQGQERRGI